MIFFSIERHIILLFSRQLETKNIFRSSISPSNTSASSWLCNILFTSSHQAMLLYCPSLPVIPALVYGNASVSPLHRPYPHSASDYFFHLWQFKYLLLMLVYKLAYSKIEKGLRALTIYELQKMAHLFNLTTDQVINYDGKIPKEIILEDKTAVEQMRLIQQLDDDDKQTIFKLIDKMLTNKKFKDFFQKNVAAL